MYSRKFFTHCISCSLVALCLLSTACARKEKGVITEQQVNALMEEMDRAANNNDVDAIVALMSKDARLSITMEGFGPTQTLYFDREQYRDYIEQTLKMTDVYDYKRGETVIKIEPEGHRALVVADIIETSTIDGRTIGTIARETSTLEIEDGKLVITRGAAVARPLPPATKARRAAF
jgi:hypothetical protein